MLRIKEISKTYKTVSLIQVALNKVSLDLRDNEFVAILGPSGSGKTTLLNIIGGLDHYDTGDLQINNISTKKYKDKDWDSYRNHTIGFVFQSYNLIPHQTILANVELALTISGISKKERKKRALNALDEVGLKEHAHKKPNQLSGGQMQRVAIARALVNNPDILLADEPTGALDSKTSIQVMELLKKVAADRLVVMVTHNPDLAKEYANRIVKLQDGEIIDDSNPFKVEENDNIQNKRIGKAKMGFFTALSLSFNNLLTKKGRTILTAFAGSIGIIGIALILSLSQGFQNYIDKIQEDTLSSYPLTITTETADATNAILSMVSDKEKANNAEENTVVERRYLTSMFQAIGTNDLKTFKKYLVENEDKYKDDVTLIRYTYSIKPTIYTIDAANNLAQLNPSNLMSSLYSDSTMSMLSSYSSSSIFSEMIDKEDEIKENYRLLKGKWPEKYNEMLLVLSEENSISDLLVYSLGLKDTTKLKSMMSDLIAGKEVKDEGEASIFSYDELLNIKLKLIHPTDFYKYNEKYNIYEDMRDDDEYMKNLYQESEDLNIVGIVVLKDDDSSQLLSPGVVYQKSLTDYIIDNASKQEIVKKQLQNDEIDVISNSRFDEEKNNKETLDFQDMISVDEKMISEAFKVNVSEDSFSSTEDTEKLVMDKSMAVASNIKEATSSAIVELNKAYADVALQLINTYETTFSYATPTSCEYYADSKNPLKGCALVNPEDESQTVDNVDDYIEVNGIDLQNFENPLIKIYVSKSLGYTQYSIFMNQFIDAYKKTALTIETLQDETLVRLTNNAFDAYVNSVKELPDFNKMTSTIDMSKITVNKEEIITNSLMDEDIQNAIFKTVSDSMEEYTYLLVAQGVAETLGETMGPIAELFSGDLLTIDKDKFANAFKFDMKQDELSRIMESMFSNSQEKTAKSNLISFGYQDIDDPTNISFYFKDFASKENFIEFLKEYNNLQEDEEKQLKYTDLTGLLMSSVKTIVDSVSYVLIAFVSISLIVSSIMIAVITLISVMERTKEIGILRAMGASKKNVSSIFNAETFIIGLLSGVMGILISNLLIVPINSIIHKLTDNNNINAVLPPKYAIILILISVFLTMFAGIIPSRKASKQDPVIALRTE